MGDGLAEKKMQNPTAAPAESRLISSTSAQSPSFDRSPRYYVPGSLGDHAGAACSRMQHMCMASFRRCARGGLDLQRRARLGAQLSRTRQEETATCDRGWSRPAIRELRVEVQKRLGRGSGDIPVCDHVQRATNDYVKSALHRKTRSIERGLVPIQRGSGGIMLFTRRCQRPDAALKQNTPGGKLSQSGRAQQDLCFIR